MGAAVLMFGLFLLTMLNAVLAGGRFGELDDTKWDEAVRWPWIPLSPWVVVAVAAVAPISMIFIARWATRSQIAELISLGVYSWVFFCMLPLIFSTMYTMPGGTVINSDHPDQGQGLHWLAAPLQIITFGVIIVRCLVLRFGKAAQLGQGETAA